MAALRVALVGCLLLAASSVALAGKEKGKIDKAKLVGTWTLVKTTSKFAPPEGAVVKVTFTKDGKITMSMKAGDKAEKREGTYTVKGDQLLAAWKGPGDKETKETMTIKELTARKFVTDEKEGDRTVTTEFKK
jgi:uncharacterized protein (TIGR03066 family)